MCGRYTLTTPVGTLVEEFGLTEPLPEVPPSYNVAPTQEVATALADGGGRHLEMLRWGLIPSWAKDPGIGSRMINARSETASEKPSFRKAFKERRCLILADGFYEWQKTNNGKQPFYIHMKGGSLFAFAGLWESWQDPEGPEIRTCTILTIDANELVAPIHNRMPVILHPEYYEPWLDSDVREVDFLSSLLRPYPSDPMEAYPVSRFVNRPANDAKQCIEPIAY